MALDNTGNSFDDFWKRLQTRGSDWALGSDNPTQGFTLSKNVGGVTVLAYISLAGTFMSEQANIKVGTNKPICTQDKRLIKAVKEIYNTLTEQEIQQEEQQRTYEMARVKDELGFGLTPDGREF